MKKIIMCVFAVLLLVNSVDAQRKKKSRKNSNFKEYSELFSGDIGKRVIESVKLFDVSSSYTWSNSSIRYDREKLSLLEDVYRIGPSITDDLPPLVRNYISGAQLPRLTGTAKRKSSKWSIRVSAQSELPLVFGSLTLWDGRLSDGKFWLQPSNVKSLFDLEELSYLLLEEGLSSSRLDFAADVRVGIKPLELLLGFHKPRIELSDQFYVGGDIRFYKVWSLDLSYKAGTELFSDQVSLEPWLDERIPDWIEQTVDVGRIADALVEGIVAKTPAYVFGQPLLKGLGVTGIIEGGVKDWWMFEELRLHCTFDRSKLSNGNVGSPEVKHFLFHVGVSVKIDLE